MSNQQLFVGVVAVIVALLSYHCDSESEIPNTEIIKELINSNEIETELNSFATMESNDAGSTSGDKHDHTLEKQVAMHIDDYSAQQMEANPEDEVAKDRIEKTDDKTNTKCDGQNKQKTNQETDVSKPKTHDRESDLAFNADIYYVLVCVMAIAFCFWLVNRKMHGNINSIPSDVTQCDFNLLHAQLSKPKPEPLVTELLNDGPIDFSPNPVSASHSHSLADVDSLRPVHSCGSTTQAFLESTDSQMSETQPLEDVDPSDMMSHYISGYFTAGSASVPNISMSAKPSSPVIKRSSSDYLSNA